MTAELSIFVACLPGLEPLVAEECAARGVAVALEPGDVGQGGIALRADFDAVMRLNLWLGCASHVLLRIARFRARHFAELHARADGVDWRLWLPEGAAVDVQATSRRSKLYHSAGIAERIAASIRRAVGAPRPGAEPLPIRVRMFDDLCSVSIDSSGPALHRRGHRLETAKAPLREDLAHALVLAAGSDLAAGLLDPCCGSGSIPIAAATIARKIPPGGGRRFAFEGLAGFDRAAWDAIRASAAAGVLPAATARVFGSDRDAGAVAIAQRNATRAGVGGDIDWAVAPLSSAPGFAAAVGCVVTNPPFGKRIGGTGDLAPLYQTLGARIAAMPGPLRVAILAADRRLALRTGIPLHTAFLTSHGGLRVRALVGETAR